jgi:hypothetical protein
MMIQAGIKVWMPPGEADFSLIKGAIDLAITQDSDMIGKVRMARCSTYKTEKGVRTLRIKYFEPEDILLKKEITQEELNFLDMLAGESFFFGARGNIQSLDRRQRPYEALRGIDIYACLEGAEGVQDFRWNLGSR